MSDVLNKAVKKQSTMPIIYLHPPHTATTYNNNNLIFHLVHSLLNRSLIRHIRDLKTNQIGQFIYLQNLGIRTYLHKRNPSHYIDHTSSPAPFPHARLHLHSNHTPTRAKVINYELHYQHSLALSHVHDSCTD